MSILTSNQETASTVLSRIMNFISRENSFAASLHALLYASNSLYPNSGEHDFADRDHQLLMFNLIESFIVQIEVSQCVMFMFRNLIATSRTLINCIQVHKSVSASIFSADIILIKKDHSRPDKTKYIHIKGETQSFSCITYYRGQK